MKSVQAGSARTNPMAIAQRTVMHHTDFIPSNISRPPAGEHQNTRDDWKIWVSNDQERHQIGVAGAFESDLDLPERGCQWVSGSAQGRSPDTVAVTCAARWSNRNVQYSHR